MPMKNPSHPGLSVRHDCLEPLGLTVTQAAGMLGVSRKQLSDLVNGHAGISPEMAIRLDKGFGGGSSTWYRLQAAYDLAQAMKIDDPTRCRADVPRSRWLPALSRKETAMNALRRCSVTCDAMIPWSMTRCEDCERNMDHSGTDLGPRNLTTTDDFDRQCEYYQITCRYHLTHIENLQSIRNLGLLSHNRAHDQTDPRDIADPEVIAIRSGRRDTVFDRPLHDYVPLYFTPTNPMLSKRRKIQSQLAILCINKNALLFDGAVFTDGNAASVDTRFFGDCRHLDQLDWACIKAPYWTDFPDGKRKRCAEVLVPDRLGLEHLQCVVVSNVAAARAVHEALPGPPVRTEPTWFF